MCIRDRSGLTVKELQEREQTISQFTEVVSDLNPSRAPRVVGDPIVIDNDSDAEDMSTNNSEDAEDDIRQRNPDKDLPDKQEEYQDTDDETMEELVRATQENKENETRTRQVQEAEEPETPTRQVGPRIPVTIEEMARFAGLSLQKFNELKE